MDKETLDLERFGADAPMLKSYPVEAGLDLVDIRKADDGSQEGVIEGYASTFGNKDLTGDVIVPGAFKASIKKRGTKGIKFLLDHDWQKRLGVFEEIKEDDKGLFVRGFINLEKEMGRDAYSDAKIGSLDSFSIGFRIDNPKRDTEWDKTEEVRTIKKIDLWENSLVTFPANPKARIQRVKALLDAGDFPDIREFERMLTRDAGFSRSVAIDIINHGYKHALTKRDAGEGDDELVAMIRDAAKIFTP
jgi:uncharacterized protein